MPTKKELEIELAELRSELAALREARTTRNADNAAGEDSSTLGNGPAEEEDRHEESRAKLKAELHEIASQLEAIAEKKPAVALIGVFVAGLLVGRLLGR